MAAGDLTGPGSGRPARLDRVVRPRVPGPRVVPELGDVRVRGPVVRREYRDMSDQVAARWPRSARVLREIATYFERDALREDNQAERHADRR